MGATFGKRWRCFAKPRTQMIAPVWTQGKPSHYGERYFAFSPKLGRQVALSSKLEYERSLLLEYDSEVSSYCEQPIEAHALIDGRVCRSRLDFSVTKISGDFFLEEVKYRSDLVDPAARAHRQLKIQRSWCSDCGYTHQLTTDGDIWRNPVLINSLRTLLNEFSEQANRVLSEARLVSVEVLDQVRRWPGLSLIDLLDGCPRGTPRELFRVAIMDLIRTRQLDAALETRRFCPRSPISLFGGRK